MAQGHGSVQHAHAEGGHVHHLSAAPILIGLGALVGYVGMSMGGLKSLRTGDYGAGTALFGAGVLIFLLAMWVWVREDAAMWRSRYVDHGVLPGRDLGWWGMAFFLGTEVVLFGGLFASFFVVRDDVPLVWERAHEHLAHAIPLVTVNTLILVSSGATMHWALHAIRKDNRAQFKAGLLLTLLLGAVFLALQMREYADLIAAGVTLSSDQFGSVFYMLTGTHAFHVLLGLVLIAILAVRAFMGQFDRERHVAVDAFAIYWHFVDVVWLLLYLVVYLEVV